MCYFKTLMTFTIILSFHNHSPWKLNHWFHAVFHIWNTHKIIWQPIISGYLLGQVHSLVPFCEIVTSSASAKQKQWNDSPRNTKKIKWRSVWLCIECFEHSKISLIELLELYCLFKGQQPNTYELITPYIKQLNPNLLNSLKSNGANFQNNRDNLLTQNIHLYSSIIFSTQPFCFHPSIFSATIREKNLYKNKIRDGYYISGIQLCEILPGVCTV